MVNGFCPRRTWKIFSPEMVSKNFYVEAMFSRNISLRVESSWKLFPKTAFPRMVFKEVELQREVVDNLNL